MLQIFGGWCAHKEVPKKECCNISIKANVALWFNMGCLILGYWRWKIQSRLQIPTFCCKVYQFQSRWMLRLFPRLVPSSLGLPVPVRWIDPTTVPGHEMGSSQPYGVWLLQGLQEGSFPNTWMLGLIIYFKIEVPLNFHFI